MKKSYLNSIIALFGAVLMLASCGSNAKSDKKSSAKGDSTKTEVKAETEENNQVVEPELVRTTKAQKKTIDKILSATAVLEGWETVNISPSATGIIEKIYKDVGQTVKVGEMLVRLDQTNLNTAKLNYANVQTEFKRIEALLAGGNTTQQQYDAVKLQLDQCKTNLDFLQKNTFFKSEISGVVSAKNFENGELYNGARGILEVTQVNVLKAIVNLPESYFPSIKKGQKFVFESDIYPGKQFPGTVETIYPKVDASTHTFQVKVRIPNGSMNLRPGMYVKTDVKVGKANAILVPYMSVLKLQGSNNRYLFLNKGGEAERVEVTLGQRFDELVELTSGAVEDGDEVVSQGQGRLIDGSPLKVLTDAE